MPEDGYRLADHVVAEPLVCDYGAWWCNVAPVPAAMHAARHLVPTLEAYLEDPETSYESALDPALAGGPFVAVPPADAPAVQHVLARLERELGEVGARFAAAVHEFDARLLAEARGQSLEPFYALCPPPLRGLVELVYDYRNRPSIRFDEGLVYRSPLYKPALQELRLFTSTSDGERGFYVTTPRVPSPGARRVPGPFVDERVRRILALDLEPKPRREVEELVDGATELLAAGPPRCAPPWEGDAPRVRYFGHATVLVEHRGVSFLVDPVIPVTPSGGGAPRLSYEDLPARIDFVAVTHAHTDHFFLESLIRLAARIGTLLLPKAHGILYGDVSLRRIAERLGIACAVEVDTFDRFARGDLEVVVAPFLGEHGDLAHGAKVTYCVRAGDETFYFAADSTCLDDAIPRELVKVFGRLDNVFMNTETEGAPISWPFDGLFPPQRNRELEATRRCRGSSFAEGARLLEVVRPRRFFSYAMGLEPWLSFILGPPSGPDTPRMREAARLAAHARAAGIAAELLRGARELRLE